LGFSFIALKRPDSGIHRFRRGKSQGLFANSPVFHSQSTGFSLESHNRELRSTAQPFG